MKKERQEIPRGGKLLKERGLEDKGKSGSARIVRDNTHYYTTGLDVCQ